MRTGTSYWNAWQIGGHFGGHFGIHLSYILAYILESYLGGQFPDAKWLCMGRVIDFGAHLIHTYHYTWLGKCVLSNKHNWNWWYRSTSGSMTGHPNWDPGSNTIVCTCFAKKKHTHLFLFRFSIRVGCSGGGAPTWWPGVGFFTCYIMRPSVSHGSPKWDSGIEIECNFLKGLISQRYSCDGYPETTWSNYSWTQVFQQIFGCIYRVAVKLQINIIIE